MCPKHGAETQGPGAVPSVEGNLGLRETDEMDAEFVEFDQDLEVCKLVGRRCRRRCRRVS